MRPSCRRTTPPPARSLTTYVIPRTRGMQCVGVRRVWRHISHRLISSHAHTPHTPQDLHKILVKHLPPGVRLTVVFDSCHSGTAMDLPYVYNENGCIDSPSMGTQPGLLWLQLM